jgi:hypothetical protein
VYSRRKVMASKTIKLIKTYLGLLTKRLLGKMENKKKIDIYSAWNQIVIILLSEQCVLWMEGF